MTTENHTRSTRRQEYTKHTHANISVLKHLPPTSVHGVCHEPSNTFVLQLAILFQITILSPLYNSRAATLALPTTTS